MLSGNDLSFAQGQIDWNTYKNNTNFAIIQSSYGVGNFDAQYGFNKGQVLQTNLLHGYYHFAYPDLNDPVSEANWFLHAISAIKPLQAGELLFLDYERNVSDNVTWVKTFLDTVSKALNGYKPLLYTEQSMLTANDFTPVVNEGYGLWIAAPTGDPNNNNFQTGAFPFASFQQWGTQTVPGITGVVDADIFFGDEAAFKAYGYQAPIPVPTPTPPDPCTQVKTQLQELQVQFDSYKLSHPTIVTTVTPSTPVVVTTGTPTSSTTSPIGTGNVDKQTFLERFWSFLKKELP